MHASVYTKVPDFSRPKLSPDGTWLAFRREAQGAQNIFLRRVGATDDMQISKSPTNIHVFEWADSDTLLWFNDAIGDEEHRALAYRVSNGNMVQCPLGGKTSPCIGGYRSRGMVSILSNQRTGRAFDVFVWDLDENNLEMVWKNDIGAEDIILDQEGNVVSAVIINDEGKALARLWPTFQILQQISGSDELIPLSFDSQEQCLLCLSNLGRDETALVEISIETGNERRLLAHIEKSDLYSAIIAGRKAIGAHFHGDKPRILALDDTLALIIKEQEHNNPEYSWELISASESAHLMTLVRFSDKSPGEFFLADVKSRTLASLGPSHPWLEGVPLASQESFLVEAQDGLPLRTFLTLPERNLGQPPPLVVLPHGGPWALEPWGFFPISQFLASRGFAVLQLNFRGSKGFGRRFLEASFREFGRAMEQDIFDAVKYVIDHEKADRNRIAIMGTSYGGYAALVGVMQRPDLFCCAVAHNALVDVFSMFSSVPKYWLGALKRYQLRIGDPVADREKLEEVNPFSRHHHFIRPIFLSATEKDVRLPSSRAAQFATLLKENGCQVEYSSLASGGHTFLRSDAFASYLEKAADFLEQHLLSQ